MFASTSGKTSRFSRSRGEANGSESKSNEQSRRQSKHFADDDDDDDWDDGITIIPDLENEQDAEEAKRAAEAPHYVRTVQSMRELDSDVQDIQGLEEFGDDRIDLSLLKGILYPRGSLNEDDGPWEFNSLLEEVSQQMTKEKETKEKHLAMMNEDAENPAEGKADTEC